MGNSIAVSYKPEAHVVGSQCLAEGAEKGNTIPESGDVLEAFSGARKQERCVVACRSKFTNLDCHTGIAGVVVGAVQGGKFVRQLHGRLGTGIE